MSVDVNARRGAPVPLSALPMIIAYVVLQRWFVAGLTAGAVKHRGG